MVFELVVYILGNHNKFAIIHAIEKIWAIHDRTCVKHNDRRILMKLGELALCKLKNFLPFKKCILGFDSMREAAILCFGCCKTTLGFRKFAQEFLAFVFFLCQTSFYASGILTAAFSRRKFTFEVLDLLPITFHHFLNCAQHLFKDT